MFNIRLLQSFFIGFLLCCSSSISALSLEQLQQQLTTKKVLRGDFIQSKTLQMFNQPLVSDGTFLLSHQQGLIWNQITPFPVTLVLAKDKLRQQFEDQTPEIIEAKDNPMVFYFSHLFLSLFKGDLSALESQFSMTITESEKETWLLHLSPKESPLNKVFKQIEIKGNKQIQSLVLTELNGDLSVIEFSNINQEQTQLSQQEENAFKF
ncbi:outer membrane lipoprotein carrier protein LolA [Psychromonas sp.]|nr:outer membrane lipoprotein carrier protein LolA [Psychromonas sp.]